MAIVSRIIHGNAGVSQDIKAWSEFLIRLCLNCERLERGDVGRVVARAQGAVHGVGSDQQCVPIHWLSLCGAAAVASIKDA